MVGSHKFHDSVIGSTSRKVASKLLAMVYPMIDLNYSRKFATKNAKSVFLFHFLHVKSIQAFFKINLSPAHTKLSKTRWGMIAKICKNCSQCK